jgi:formylmethanofuran dehydrogenase subunit E
MTKKEITDPKLLRYRRASKGVKSVVKTNITKIKDAYQKPDPSISMIMDGKPVEIKPELVFTIYRCNKCNENFNHTHAQAIAGRMPACPRCDV